MQTTWIGVCTCRWALNPTGCDHASGRSRWRSRTHLKPLDPGGAEGFGLLVWICISGVCVFTSGNLNLLTGAAKSVSERTVGATGGGMAALRWLCSPSPSLYFSCRCTWRLYIACLTALVCPSAGGPFLLCFTSIWLILEAKSPTGRTWCVSDFV